MNTPFAYAAVTWTQTDWSGGDGQADWVDTTQYDSAGSDGVRDSLTAGEVSMDIVAEIVIGQTNFTGISINQGGSAAANTLNAAAKVSSNGTKLFVADTYNNRVLIYNTIPTSNNASADVVVGQPNMTSGDGNQGGSVAANTLFNPWGVYSDGTKLFVADTLNNRVLIYNTIPTANNASADVVIGQPDMTSGDINNGGIGANTFYYPGQVYSDGTKLFVVDAFNNRVLIYNTIPTANNASADVVVGQPDMTSSGANNGGIGANTLSLPFGVYSDGTKLFVMDNSNSRVLIYNTIPTANNTSADVVIGQANMTSAANGIGANRLNYPGGVFADGTRIYMADTGSSRALIYSGSHTSTLTSSIYDAGTSYTWGPLTYTATEPTNTDITFEVSTDGGTIWEAVTDYTTQTFGPSETVAYRATLSNTDGISTPILQEVSISGNLVPTVTTSSATSLSPSNATFNGEITDTGGVDADERGFNYGLTIAYGSTVTETAGPYGIGAFTASLTNLNCNTTYHYRAYATNVAGTGYGDDASFDTESCISSSGSSGNPPPPPPPPEPTLTCVSPQILVNNVCVNPPPSPPPPPPVTPPTTPPPTIPPTTPPEVTPIPPPIISPPPVIPEPSPISIIVAPSPFEILRNFLNIPAVRTIENVAIAIPAALSLLVLLASLFSGVPFFNYLFYLFIILSQILGFRRKPKPWGIVYDSMTKRPLSFARVEILNEQSRKLQSAVTDVNGRYGFLISEKLSNIQLQAHLTKYDFPSKKEPSVVEQKLYPNIYQGGPTDASGGLANFDLPMDPRDKTITRNFYFGITSVKLNNLLSLAANVLFVLGSVLGVANAIANPRATSFVILAIIFFTFVLRTSGFKLKPFGLTKDRETSQILPFGLVALHSQGGERMNFTVSDDSGRYFLLAPKGNYLLKAYTPSHIFPARTKEVPIVAKKGWISEEIEV